jgi:8-oxo-dGTP pyrophosphatase MutT (NUDIX family)
MKLIKIIKDEELGLSATDPAPVTRRREAVRAILLDGEGRVGLICATAGGFYKLPGGGINKGETKEAALHREVIEEAGYEIEIVGEVGQIIEYRLNNPDRPGSGLEQISYCYVARATKYVGANLMEDEAGDGFELIWVENVEKAIGLIKAIKARATNWTNEYEITFYEAREQALLEAYLALGASDIC